MVDHEALIQQLANDAPAVSRPLPAAMRALLWSALAVALGLAASRLMPTARLDWSAPGAGLFVVNAGLSLGLGFAALAWAFTLSIPGRPSRGFLLILAMAGLWLAVNIASILGSTDPMGGLHDGRYCFRFVVMAGAPMVVVTLYALRRSRSLRPTRTLAMAGAAIGFLSFGLLALCHPAGMTVVDFVMHILAAVVLALVTQLAGRRLIAG